MTIKEQEETRLAEARRKAQNDLGVCYCNGQGVTQDYSQAVYWFRKAAEQGHAYAQGRLGLCYQNGRGVTQDDSLAEYWINKGIQTQQNTLR